MRHLVMLALAACGTDATTETPPSAACAEAEGYQNLASIESKVFAVSCQFSSCHGGTVNAPDLRAGKSYASLVGVTSHLDPSRTFVVPGHPEQSFLLVMLGAVAPSEMSPPLGAIPSPGPMPLASPALCPEKLDAIRRWIEAGAAND